MDRRAGRPAATSPAVGVYHPKSDATPGIDLAAEGGAPVVAPADGLVGPSLVEPGEAVEYGQELVLIELAEPGSGTAGAGVRPAAGEG